MSSVFAAEGAIFIHFESVRIVFLIFDSVVIPLLAFRTYHRYFNSHLFPLSDREQ